MKNFVTLAFGTLLVCWIGHSEAQVTRSVTVKGALTGAFHPNYKMALEWQPRRHWSIELTAGYRRYNQLRQDAFNGVRSNEYALRRIYNTHPGTANQFNDSGWQYFGDGRPISPFLKESYTPLSSIRLHLGCRRYFQLITSGLHLFIQPGISTALLNTYEITDVSNVLVQDDLQRWFDGGGATVPQIVRHTKYYQSTQRVERKRYWFVGPSILGGASWHLPKGLMVEARYQVGMNMGQTVSAGVPDIPAFRYWYTQLEFLVGYRWVQQRRSVIEKGDGASKV